jgi:hypothetical protein
MLALAGDDIEVNQTGPLRVALLEPHSDLQAGRNGFSGIFANLPPGFAPGVMRLCSRKTGLKRPEPNFAKA